MKSEKQIKILETKYDDNEGNWYVVLGFNEKRVIVKIDSIQEIIIKIKEI